MEDSNGGGLDSKTDGKTVDSDLVNEIKHYQYAADLQSRTIISILKLRSTRPQKRQETQQKDGNGL